MPLSQTAAIGLLRALHRRILQVWALLWQSHRSSNKSGASRPQQGAAADRKTLAGFAPSVLGVMHLGLFAMSEMVLYGFSWGYPVSFILFLIGSLISARKERTKLSVGLAFGFLLLIFGYFLQNFGPQEVTSSTQGTTVFKYTWLYPAGGFASGLGMFIAATCFLFKALKYVPTENA